MIEQKDLMFLPNGIFSLFMFGLHLRNYKMLFFRYLHCTLILNTLINHFLPFFLVIREKKLFNSEKNHKLMEHYCDRNLLSQR